MKPLDPTQIIFIHGLEGSSQGDKARLLRGLFPEMLTPDFRGPLDERMQALVALLGKRTGWSLIGSSLGGLMAALFTCQHPAQVRKLILLAPALILPEFSASPPAPIDVPTVVYHGTRDNVVPLEPTRRLAVQVFRKLDFHVVDDEHRLFKTMQEVEWKKIV